MQSMKIEHHKTKWDFLKNPWICFCAMIIGVIIGLYFKPIAYQLKPISVLFTSLLEMSAFPIIITAIIISMAHLIREGRESRYLMKVFKIFIIGALLASSLAVLVGTIGKNLIRVSDKQKEYIGHTFIEKGQHHATSQESQNNSVHGTSNHGGVFTHSFWDFILNFVPHNVFDAFSTGRMLAAIFVATLMGAALGVISSSKSDYILNSCEGIFQSFITVLEWTLFGLPLGLISMFADHVSTFGPEALLSLSGIIILYLIVMSIMFIIYLYAIKRSTGLSIFNIIYSLRKTFLVAFSADVASAIPVAFEDIEENLKLNTTTTNFTVPLSSVFNRHATPIIFAITTIFVAELYQESLSIPQYIFLIIASSIVGMFNSGEGVAMAPIIGFILAPLGLPVFAGVTILLIIIPLLRPLTELHCIFTCCTNAALIGKKIESTKE